MNERTIAGLLHLVARAAGEQPSGLELIARGFADVIDEHVARMDAEDARLRASERAAVRRQSLTKRGRK